MTIFKNIMKSSVFSLLSPIIILLPIAALATTYASNIDRITPEIFLMSAVYLTLGFVVFRIVAGGFFATSKLATLFSACIFIGVAMFSLENIYIHLMWLLSWVLLAVAIFFKKSLVQPIQFGIYFLIVNSFVQLLVSIFANPVLTNRDDLKQDFSSSFSKIEVNQTEGIKRDVYYIVLDRYGRKDQLNEVYKFDNSNFLDKITAEGFLVAQNAYSNYQRTAHSLTSSMNLAYLTQVEKEPSSDWVPLYAQLKNSEIFKFFDAMNYEIHFMGSWWEVTRTNTFADVDFNFRAWPELVRVVVENSIVGKFASITNNSQLDQRQIQCKRIQKKFAELQSLPSKFNPDKPKFIFAHFLVPHPPFVIDKDGACMKISTAENRSRSQNYTEQILYANKQLLTFFENVKTTDQPHPIIIFQADEGPWPQKFARDEITRLGHDVTSVDWTKVSGLDLKEKMGILNAVYLPGKTSVIFDNNSSPVNNFRLILNEYFGTNLPMLENRSYIFRNNQDLYRYEDVTEKLK